MSVVEIVSLIAAGVAAGAINAVAGGGTLVTFPTLLFFQTPPVIAHHRQMTRHLHQSWCGFWLDVETKGP